MPKEQSFYNPYRILRQPARPDRRYRPDISRLPGYVGRLECQLEVHTPLEVNYRRNARFYDAPLVPGTSIKGVIRSVAEFAGSGCMSISSDRREDGPWRICDQSSCCPTCDMFGRLKGSVVNRGKVRIGDALPVAVERAPLMRLLQGTPKETHDAFYPRSGANDSYRKFYHHQPAMVSPNMPPDKAPTKSMTPSDIFPVKAGSVFAFRVDFEGLDASQVALLVWALELEPGLLHKLGRAKGRGLGSVKVRLKEFSIQTAAGRYAGEGARNDWPEDVEKALADIKADTRLDDLRRILSWQSARKLTPMRYPSFAWFKANSQVQLRRVGEVVEGVPRDGVDPEFVQVKARPAPVAVAARTFERPENFDEVLWAKLNPEARGVIERIGRRQSPKAEAQPVIEKYKASTDQDFRRGVVLAFSNRLPKERGWLAERFGEEFLPGAMLAQAAAAASPMDEAIDRLRGCEAIKDIGKKILGKAVWDQLGEDGKRQFAGEVREWAKGKGLEDDVETLKKLKPYL